MSKKNSSNFNKSVGLGTAALTGGLSLGIGGGNIENSGKKINKLAGNSIQSLGKVDPVTGYANKEFGDKYLDYRPTSELKSEQSARDEELAKQAQIDKEAVDLQEQRKRSRNSIFQTEGTGGVLTNSVSARQSYFGN